MQPLTLEGATTTPGHALAIAEERKLAAHMHAEDCCLVRVNFIPLVMESLGGWAQDPVDIVKVIGRLLMCIYGHNVLDPFHWRQSTIWHKKYHFLFG